MSLLRPDRVIRRHRPVTGGQRSHVPESLESMEFILPLRLGLRETPQPAPLLGVCGQRVGSSWAVPSVQHPLAY